MNKLIACFSALCLLFASSAYATKYYVNDNSRTGDIYCSAIGSNTNNGTAASTPKATLANVLSTFSNSFAAADTIFVDAGTYTNTDVNLTSPKNGVVIKGAGPNLLKPIDTTKSFNIR